MLNVGDRITTRFGGYESRAYIYHLLDPRDESVRYVGSTNDPLKRYSAHVSEALKMSHRGLHNNNKKSVWIRELADLGYEPILLIVGVCHRDQAADQELAEYHRLVNAGASLVNFGEPRGNAYYARTNAALGLLEGVR